MSPESYVQCLKVRYVRWGTILFYMVLVAAGGLLGPRFLSETKLEMDAPPGSQAKRADDMIKKTFPLQYSESSAVILIEGEDEAVNINVVNNASRQFESAVHGYLERNTSQWKRGSSCYVAFDGYYMRENAGQTVEAERFLAKDRLAMIEIVTLTIHFGQGNVTAFVSDLVKLVKKASSEHLEPAGMQARMTGIDAFLVDVLTGVEHDIAFMDIVAFPIALAILVLVLRSLRLLILPLLGMIICILGSFLVMYPIAANLSVVTFAPSVQMSLSIALSIDYALFMLGRYREELQRNPEDHDGAVSTVLRYAGHVITVSNTTLAICFLGNLFFNSILLSTIGIAAAITCCFALLVNLTLLPVLLLTFPAFFRRSAEPWNCCSAKVQNDSINSSTLRGKIQIDPILHRVSFDRASSGGRSRRSMSVSSSVHVSLEDNRCWHSIATAVVKYWYLVVLFTLLLASPFAWRLSKGFRHSTSLLQLTPRDATSTTAFRSLQEKFGAGLTAPYRVVIVPPEGQPVLGQDGTADPTYCNISSRVLRDFIAPSRVVSGMDGGRANITSSVLSLTYVSELPPSLDLCSPNSAFGGLNIAQICTKLHWPSFSMDGASCKDLKLLYEQYNISSADPSQTAGVADVMISIDPNAPIAGIWLDELRESIAAGIQEVPGAKEWQFLVSSISGTQYASNKHAYTVFPYAIGITSVVVFLLVGIAFRTAVVPLRAVFSIGLTIVIVYGAATFIYEDGALEWLGFPGLSPQQDDHSLCWITPILCFSIVVGLGLDYDVFLLSRIVELRVAGRSDRASIITGLTKTGSTITAAGCIMATAFSGLLFSAEPVLNQISFFLVFAVLVDTFIIRALMVPAMMAGLGAMNWWPRRMPQVGSRSDFEESLLKFETYLPSAGADAEQSDTII